ncbi:MAG: amino acid-binding protein [Gammaproteobacteria bacterium]|nr:amino acid-binding protein [Gammaproteobacteria bacterium]
MAAWFMITLVGEDQPNIVASVTRALFEAQCHLGETSMIRLGGNFTIMMMVKYNGEEDGLSQLLQPLSDKLHLRLHVDPITGHLHQHRQPDVRISVFSADRPGIVAKATGSLADAGLDITDLESDVGGSETKPIYIMHIEGVAKNGIDALESAVADIRQNGIDVTLTPIELMIG